MNLYHCLIDLKEDAKALSFAHALSEWMAHLQAAGTIGQWRLLHCKLNLASGGHRDFLLEIELRDMAQLDAAFRHTGQENDEVAALYSAVHSHIEAADFGLYRPFPDPERSERMALI